MQRNGPLRFTSRTRCHVVVGGVDDRRPRLDRGAAHEHVEPAVLLDDRLEHRRDLALVGDVDDASAPRRRRRRRSQSATCCAASSSMSATTTVAPSAASRRAIASPRPDAAAGDDRDPRPSVARRVTGTPPGRRRPGSPRRSCTPTGRARGTARCRRRPRAVPSRCSGIVCSRPVEERRVGHRLGDLAEPRRVDRAGRDHVGPHRRARTRWRSGGSARRARPWPRRTRRSPRSR